MGESLIQNAGRAKQVCNFYGLQFGGKCAMDVDLFMDFSGRAWVLGELKYGDKEMSKGQRIAIEQFCFDMAHLGKPVLAFVASHLHPEDEEIDCANATVRLVWHNGTWVSLHDHITVRAVMERFFARHGLWGTNG